MTLNPWKRLEERQRVIDRIEREVEEKRTALANRNAYIKKLENRLIEHERMVQSLREDKADLQSYLDSVWQVMQEWKPPHVVRMYDEGDK